MNHLFNRDHQILGPHQPEITEWLFSTSTHHIAIPHSARLLSKRVTSITFCSLILKVLLLTVSHHYFSLTLPLLVVFHQVCHHSPILLILYAHVDISFQIYQCICSIMYNVRDVFLRSKVLRCVIAMCLLHFYCIWCCMGDGWCVMLWRMWAIVNHCGCVIFLWHVMLCMEVVGEGYGLLWIMVLLHTFLESCQGEPEKG